MKKLITMSASALVFSMSCINQVYAEEAQAAVTEPAVPAITDADSASAAAPLKKSVHETHQMLGDVVVSASKIQQSSMDAPTNVSVINAKQIEKTNSQRIGDALVTKVPGLYLRGGAQGNSRPGATASISMRGQGSTLTKVAVLVDGMNMVDAYSGQVNWAMVSMDDIDNVEVVPGVGSSLYGSNAMGGVISITTKAPTKREINLKAGIGFNDAKGKYASALYRDKTDNGVGIVLGVSRNDRDGYIAEYVTKTPSGTPGTGAVSVTSAIPTQTTTGTTTYIVGDKGRNASTASNAHGKLYFDLGSGAQLHAGFAYSDNKSLGDSYNSYLVNAATGTALPISTASTNISINGLGSSIKEANFYGSLPMGNTALRYFAGYDGELQNAKLHVNVGKIRRDSWSSAAGATATATTGSGTMYSSPNDTTNAILQVTSPLNQNHLLIAGTSLEIGVLNQKKYTLSNWSDLSTKTGVIDSVDARSTTNSLFLQDQYSMNDDVILYLGGRYDSWKAGGTAWAGSTASVPGTTYFSDRTSSAISPKIAGVYRISDGISVKSSLGAAFRAPTNYYLFANPTFSGAAAPNEKMIYSNPDLKPEKARGFDIGAEIATADGANYKATWFITKTVDMMYQKVTKVATYTDTVINKVIDYEARQENTGSALARGIELSAEYPLAAWLTLSGSYAYTDARITSDLTNTGMAGKRVTNVPKNAGTLAAEARHGHFSSLLSARYVGEVYSNNDNSDVVKDVWTGYSNYTVVNFKAGYQFTKEYRINLMVDNLFDKTYYEYYRMPGRGITLEFSGKF